MDRRLIGTLEVSVVGVGCNQFGTRSCDPDTSIRIIHEALDVGVNLFDTADEYGQNYADPSDPGGWGASEEVLGRALAGRRDDAVLATKFGAHPHGEPHLGGASARWVRRALEGSLRRLRTDHVDLTRPDNSRAGGRMAAGATGGTQRHSRCSQARASVSECGGRPLAPLSRSVGRGPADGCEFRVRLNLGAAVRSR